MRKRQQSGRRKLLLGYGLVVAVILLSLSLVTSHFRSFVDLLASSIDSLNGATTTVFFMPSGDETIVLGGTTSVDIDINTRVPINALGATISFPKDSIEIISISKEKSFFDLWTEDTAISEDSGEIRFSGGTTKHGGMLGTGTILTLTVRAKNASSSVLDFKNIQVYPNNASGKAITTDARSITYAIEDTAAHAAALVGSSGGIGGTLSSALPAGGPNVDFNNDGVVNLIDLSILTVKLIAPYDPRFDVNADGAVNLGDISTLLSKMITGH